MSLVGYDDKTVGSRLTPWGRSTAGALRFVSREKQRVEVVRVVLSVKGCLVSYER